LGPRAANSGLPRQSLSNIEASTETSRCPAQGGFRNGRSRPPPRASGVQEGARPSVQAHTAGFHSKTLQRIRRKDPFAQACGRAEESSGERLAPQSQLPLDGWRTLPRPGIRESGPRLRGKPCEVRSLLPSPHEHPPLMRARDEDLETAGRRSALVRGMDRAGWRREHGDRPYLGAPPAPSPPAAPAPEAAHGPPSLGCSPARCRPSARGTSPGPVVCPALPPVATPWLYPGHALSMPRPRPGHALPCHACSWFCFWLLAVPLCHLPCL